MPAFRVFCFDLRKGSSHPLSLEFSWRQFTESKTTAGVRPLRVALKTYPNRRSWKLVVSAFFFQGFGVVHVFRETNARRFSNSSLTFVLTGSSFDDRTLKDDRFKRREPALNRTDHQRLKWGTDDGPWNFDEPFRWWPINVVSSDYPTKLQIGTRSMKWN